MNKINNAYVSKIAKSSDTLFKNIDLSKICENKKTGGLSLALENFSVIIIELSNEESLGILSNFSNCDTSRSGITTFKEYFD